MARARTVKPGFFRDEELSTVCRDARLLFAGLWTIADRAGRLEDKPRLIKLDVFPFDDDLGSAQVDHLLSELHERGFITRYVVDGKSYIQVERFAKHQNPHPREAASAIPENTGDFAKPRQSHGESTASRVSAGTSTADLDPDPDPERDPGHGQATPARVSRADLPAPVLSGSLPKDHLKHALCAPNFAWCVPEQVHFKLAGRLAPKHGGDVDAAKAALLAWYPTVWASLPPDTVMPDAFRFWGDHFDASFAATSARPAKPQPWQQPSMAPVPSAAATRAKYLGGGA